MHINGRKHVLKHGGHQFDVHAVGSKVVEDEQRVMRELLLVHPVLLQRRDHVFDEAVLKGERMSEEKVGEKFLQIRRRGRISAFTLNENHRQSHFRTSSSQPVYGSYWCFTLDVYL